MKERIVIKDTEQTFNIVAQLPTQLKPKDFEHETEQVPETWEELKELCADLDGKTADISCNILQDEIDVSVWNTDNQTKVGDIEFLLWVGTLKMSLGTGMSVDISIPRAWQIIKGLIGE